MSAPETPAAAETPGEHGRSPKRRRIAEGYEESSPSSAAEELVDGSGYDSAALESNGSDTHLNGVPQADHVVSDVEPSNETPDELDNTYHADGIDRSLEESPDSSVLAPEEDENAEPRRSSTPRRRRTINYRQNLILKGHKGGVSCVRFSPNGKWIASCSADATIKIWDSTTGAHLRTLEGHLAGISTLAWSPDSKTVASGSDDKSIRFWDASTGKAYPMPLVGHHNYVYSIAFSPKGNMLVSGSYDEAVFLWDVRSGRMMRSLPAHSDPVGGVDFVRDGTLVVSCAGDGLIRVWDSATGQCLRTLVHEDNPPVSSVRFSPNGKFVLAWTLDSSVRLWNYVEGRCIKTYQGHLNTKFSLSGAFGAFDEEAFVVSGSEDGSLVMWDVKSKNILRRLEGHEGPVLAVDTFPAKDTMVSCGLDGTVRIWRDGPAIENNE